MGLRGPKPVSSAILAARSSPHAKKRREAKRKAEQERVASWQEAEDDDDLSWLRGSDRQEFDRQCEIMAEAGLDPDEWNALSLAVFMVAWNAAAKVGRELGE